MTVKEWLKGLETSFAFSYFLCSMTFVLIGVADSAMHIEYPTYEIDGEKMSGEAVSSPTPFDCAMLYATNFSARSMALTQQVHRFIRWYLEQEVDDDLRIVHDPDKMGELWNEFSVKGDSGNV